MKPHLEELLNSTRDKNAGTLIGAFATETPSENIIYLQLIEGLLCSGRVWTRPTQLDSTESKALTLLADEIRAGAEIAVCSELVKLMRVRGLVV